jgi:SRSO17 transposase
VYLTYATDAGHAFIDCELYLPRSWVDDPERRAAVGVPADMDFATKPALSRQMIARALDAGVAARWVAGDEVYGADPRLRGELETRGVGYVLAVGSDRRVVTEPASCAPTRQPAPCRAEPGSDTRPATVPWAHACMTGHWSTSTPTSSDIAGCSSGATRPPVRSPTTATTRPTPRRWPPWSPRPGARWTVEETFQTGKGLCGLDQHQVRLWLSWQR